MAANTGHRIIILGAGAIGCTIGGYLALAGSEVVLIGRPSHVAAIRERGLRFVTPYGTHNLKLAAATSPSQVNFKPGDLVFLCVKSQDTEVALPDLRAWAKDVPVFCFQNGVRNEERAATHFSPVYGVSLRCGGKFIANGEVTAHSDPPGWLIIGKYPSGHDELLESIAAGLRRAGFRVMVTSDIMLFKWGKLVRNINNAIVALTNASASENARAIEALQTETQEILRQAGIKWVSEEALPGLWPEIGEQHRSSLTSGQNNSIWQSLTRRQGTVETDFFNGEVIRLARKLGLTAPINQKLTEIVQGMAIAREPPGKYSPAQLSQVLGVK